MITDALVHEAKDGDENALNQVLKKFYRIARNAAYGTVDENEMDDFIQEGVIKVWKGVKERRRDSKQKAVNYLITKMKGGFSDYREMKKAKKRFAPLAPISLDSVDFSSEDTPGELINWIVSDRNTEGEALNQMSERELFQRLKESLPPREYTIALCIGYGVTWSEICKRLPCCTREIVRTKNHVRALAQ